MADHHLEEQLLALIEIPKGSRNKYEYDEGIGKVILDRFLSSSTVYPTDYGYLIGYRGRDEDPLDWIVCVPNHDPNWNHAETLEDVPEQLQREISHFFSIYKDLEGKKVDIHGWRSREEALDVIDDARRLQEEY